ncbi:MAG: hypothetical protein WA005_11315 [Candidatus Binataceae bacterium]
MFRRHTPKHPKRLFAADSALLREKFPGDFQLSGGPADVPSVPDAYREWLRSHGIDPESGKMTEAGLAFFKACLDKKDSTQARRVGQ